jgi:3D (Asp-Asp-Asp) domain-containing protein
LASGIATAYGPPWGGIQGGGTTATGIDLHGAPHKLIVAVDPSVVPLGSRLKIWPNPFGDPNLIFTAADTGGAIKSPHLFDFYDWRGRASQLNWGSKTVNYQIVGKGSPKDAATLGTAAASASGAAPAPAAAPSSSSSGSVPGSGVAGMLAGPLLRGLVYVGLVGAGVVIAGYGTYHAANATARRKVPA